MANETLTPRQKLVLALVIRHYIETAEPVGSKVLVEDYQLDFSSATVRNEMVALTDLGYLHQPHVSAGRVPTESGYRYFVGELTGHSELPVDARRTISHQFYQAGNDMDDWMRLAASVLAHQSHSASLVTAPLSAKTVFKHLELISTLGRQVLMVLVLEGGEVRQQMLVLAEPVMQEKLSQVAAQINETCSGYDAERISLAASQMDELGRDIIRLIAGEVGHGGALSPGEVYRDGLTYVLGEPEFSDSGPARNALKVLEERTLLEDLLTRTVMNTDIGGVQVVIGGEGIWEELRDCSMVLARYGVPGLATGMLGILGPIRMAYGRNISTVRFVANLLSNFVGDMASDQGS
ncbi:MAG TPA: heat-inducible transcriptional repressor HrcA [Anaerolineales bacterium]|nr:heat-inducible transcriptional repressor HrcA [Anaerolineales bacterium]